MPVLVEKLAKGESENPAVLVSILDELHDCMKLDTAPCLDINAMNVFTALLRHKIEAVQQVGGRVALLSQLA